MRWFVGFMLIAGSSRAEADGFVDFGGGVVVPLAGSTWATGVDPSPKFAARGGGVQGNIGGMLGVDWTAVQVRNPAATGPFYRFRALVQILGQHRVGSRVTLVGRAGCGVDLGYERHNHSNLGEMSDTDTGLALELGGGVWFDVGSTMKLGGELALPVGYHSHKSTGDGDFTSEYSSYDLDVLFGIRVLVR